MEHPDSTAASDFWRVAGKLIQQLFYHPVSRMRMEGRPPGETHRMCDLENNKCDHANYRRQAGGDNTNLPVSILTPMRAPNSTCFHPNIVSSSPEGLIDEKKKRAHVLSLCKFFYVLKKKCENNFRKNVIYVQPPHEGLLRHIGAWPAAADTCFSHYVLNLIEIGLL